MRPLTLHKPKALLQLQDRPLLEWSLMSLISIVKRVIVVVHYRKEQIAEYMAAQQLFEDYQLVEQIPEPLGTGHALRCCRDHLRSDDFLVINGDDLFGHEGLRRLSRTDFGLLSTMRDDYTKYGVVLRDQAGALRRIDEKPPRSRYPAPAPCNIGAYKFKTAVFAYKPAKSARGEFEITDYATAAARDHRMTVVDSPFWLPIGDPAALAAAQRVDIARWISPQPPAPSHPTKLRCLT